MELILNKKPIRPIIIERFPGMGFVGTIASEYLIEKLNTVPIGQLWSPKIPPVAMIHGSEVRSLLEVRYAKKQNIIILHAVAGVKNIEWELADAIIELAKKVKAKEVISLEGIAPIAGNEHVVYYHASDSKKGNRLKSSGAVPLGSGAIIGVSAALMNRAPKTIPTSFLFGSTHTNMPDSAAAANLIQILDRYLKLKVDYEPLLKEAEKFEEQLKDMVQKSEEAKKTRDKKEISYLG